MKIPRRARRVLFPVLERTFTYERYDDLLARLSARNLSVVALEDFATVDATDRPVFALRHDVDQRLDSALELGRLEHGRGLRATYFVLHTAEYWSDPKLLTKLLVLQDDYGHEIGWHNDLVTLQCVFGIDPRRYLERELERLRLAGIRVRGVSSHGSSFCYRFGYHNNYFFADFEGEVVPGFPNVDVVETQLGQCVIGRAALKDFGFEYEAYHLDNNLYYSDTASSSGRRWHPDDLELGAILPGDKAIVLIHPCHWDRSFGAKAIRLGGHLAVTRRSGAAPDP